MKYSTAINNLNRIVEKIESINGIYCAPLCYQDFIKIKRVWLFGSVAKGAENPNDLDLFIELYSDKSYRRKGRQRVFRNSHRLHGSYKPSKLSRNRATTSPASATDDLTKWLKKGTLKTSIHFVGDDSIFDTLDCKRLVYPRKTLQP